MLTADLDYDLPQQLIATEPAHPRDAARLMVVHRRLGRVEHRHVRDLAQVLLEWPSRVDPSALTNADPRANDLLIFNDTRVLPAYLTATRAETGGRVTGLYLGSFTRGDERVWQVVLESRGTLRVGECLRLHDRLEEGSTPAQLELIQRQDGGGWLASLIGADDTPALLERVGSPPLPPYIRRRRRAQHEDEFRPGDRQRYNTVYATSPGSVAAPTAGLHFTDRVLNDLGQHGIQRATVTLHIGLGTFAPVRTERLHDHPIHREHMVIPETTIKALRQARAQGQRIIPIGTTAVRALESLPDPLPTQGAFSADTQLFITPGQSPNSGAGGASDHEAFPLRFTDGLMTNFHLPRSTLLAMVAALPGVGLDRLKNWYRQAIEHRYRFYSYGDAMLIL